MCSGRRIEYSSTCTSCYNSPALLTESPTIINLLPCTMLYVDLTTCTYDRALPRLPDYQMEVFLSFSIWSCCLLTWGKFKLRATEDFARWMRQRGEHRTLWSRWPAFGGHKAAGIPSWVEWTIANASHLASIGRSFWGCAPCHVDTVWAILKKSDPGC